MKKLNHLVCADNLSIEQMERYMSDLHGKILSPIMSHGRQQDVWGREHGVLMLVGHHIIDAPWTDPDIKCFFLQTRGDVSQMVSINYKIGRAHV